MFFGRGIVETLEDFGTRGAWPSHPELLDWLARDFVDNGWNIKRTIKQILMSATYRQSATFGDTKLEMDPANVYTESWSSSTTSGRVHSGQRSYAGGVLDQQVGGKSVKPYQPPRIWNEVSLDGNLKYQRDEGAVFTGEACTLSGSDRPPCPTWWHLMRPPAKNASSNDRSPTPPCRHWSP